MCFSGIDLAFAPSPERAGRLDALMRERLSDSLTTIAAELECIDTALAQDLAAAVDGIRAATVESIVFARYFDLVRAIADEHEPGLHAAIAALVEDVRRPRPCARVLDLVDADLGAGAARAVSRVIDDDDGGLAPGPVGSEAVARFGAMLDETLLLIGPADPALAGEIDLFGRTIILARSTRPGRGFGGITTPFLWGAVVLNPERWRDRLALAEALAHENAHALLFGLAEGQPLSANDRAQRFASPLRSDPRPMEGIVHATFVLARMIACLERLLAMKSLSPDERDQAVAALHRHRMGFLDGLAVIDAHARLTDRGSAILAHCRAAMRPAEPVGSAPA